MGVRSFKTAKGTELPVLNLDGRDYLEVKYRLVWFREDHPDWSIETELFNITDVSACGRAIIRDEQSRVMATSHKFESADVSRDFIERAETGSIGRALALVGYGTQFCADEFKDDPARDRSSVVRLAVARPVDHAVDKRSDVSADATEDNAGSYRINFGQRYKGKMIREIKRSELQGYLTWLEKKGVRPGTQLAQRFEMLKEAMTRYYS